jgi:phage I-like protein
VSRPRLGACRQAARARNLPAMTEITAHLFQALDPAADSAPGWVHLLPAGTFSGADGRGPFDAGDLAALIAASMAAGQLPIDENHATDLAGKQGQPAPARGWITAMEARDDGVWGRVEWTASGQALLADKAYRGISPVFLATKDGGQVTRILRAALTNDPNLPLKTLHTRSQDMDLSAFRTALKLPEAADGAAILAAVTALHMRSTETDAALARLAKAAGAPDGADADALMTHLQAQAAKIAGAGDAAKLADTVVQLQTQLDTLKSAQAKAEAVRVIDAAITAGKPIKALRDHYIARHQADPAGVAKELEAMPSLHEGGVKAPARGREASLPEDASPEEISRQAALHAKEHGLTHAQAVLAITGRA